MQSPQILLTGATGFIGRFLLLALLQQGECVVVLLRNPKQQRAELSVWLEERGGNAAQVVWIQGDLAQPQAGIEDWSNLQQIKVLYHTGALFGWGLSPLQAQQVNVQGSVQLIEALHQHTPLERVIGVSGYMLTMHAHLQQAGIDLDHPLRTDWSKVYQRLGAYEASKIEAHYQLINTCQQHQLAWTVVHPATVIGDQHTGEILAHQPFAKLMMQLKTGQLSGIPATPDHRLPLACLDDVIAVLVSVRLDPASVGQCLLVADANTPNLATVLHWAANIMQVKAPTRHVPLPLLRLLLRWSWLAKQLNLSPEMLDFFRTETLDTQQTDDFRKRMHLMQPNLRHTVERTAYYLHTHPTAV